MRYIKLNKTEQSILEAYEKGELVPVKDQAKEKERYKEYAKNTIDKTKNINIRLSVKDIQKLKTKALENGLPYQTLIASLIHQYTSEKIDVRL